MTGNAGLGISTPTTSQAPTHHGLGDRGSSTDTSSVSRQSIFELVQEPHPESPRTSHEISEPEDQRRGADVSTGRKKPPPPSSRHGKLIKVELRDDHSTLSLASPTSPGSSCPHQYSSSGPAQRLHTDLNKPLPPPPASASHDSDRESIFDKEAAGKTPEPSSPSASLRRKTPPAPPLARRHSQRASDSKLTGRSGAGRLSPKVEEDGASIISSIDVGKSPSDSGRVPPPPPSRRPASVRVSSHAPLTLPLALCLPPVPPVRGSSKSVSGRPPSIASMDISTPPVSSPNTPNNRASMMPPPPPPPPRHGGKNSLEGDSRRTSAEHGRQSMDGARRGSETSSITRLEGGGSPEPLDANDGRQDLLAEMSKLQREIDAARNQSERGESHET